MKTQSPNPKSAERIAWLQMQIAKHITEICTLTAKSVLVYAANQGTAPSPAAVTRKRGRPPKMAKTIAQKSNGKGQTQTAVVMSWITKAGISKGALFEIAQRHRPVMRPNHVGIALKRLLKMGQISERSGKFYLATKTPARQQKTATEQRAPL